MRIATVLLSMAALGASPPTPAPTRTPGPTPAPTSGPAVSRVTPGERPPADLSSFARTVKVDRSRADALFRQDGPPPASATAPAGSDRPKPGIEGRTPAPSGDEARWRSRAEALRRNLDDARERMARTERNLPPGATSSEGTAQRGTLLHYYQVEVDQARAALDALADECRQSADCQPGWVR